MFVFLVSKRGLVIGVSLLESVLCQSNVLLLRFCACNNVLANNGPLLAFTVHGTLGFHPTVEYSVWCCISYVFLFWLGMIEATFGIQL